MHFLLAFYMHLSHIKTKPAPKPAPVVAAAPTVPCVYHGVHQDFPGVMGSNGFCRIDTR